MDETSGLAGSNILKYSLSIHTVFWCFISSVYVDGDDGNINAQPWLGVWESTERSENFHDFIASLGVSTEKHGKLSKTFVTYRQEGDHFFAETFVPGTNYTQSICFRFGEAGTGKRFGTSMKVISSVTL